MTRLTSVVDVNRRTRWAIVDLGPSPDTKAPKILIPSASTAARLGAWSANLGQTAHYSQAIADFVDRRSRTDRVGPVGWPRTEKKTATIPDEACEPDDFEDADDEF
jgi:hypothetical protein